MAKLPNFPFCPEEYLLDEKIESLTVEEEGINLRLWCFQWINKIKRGHLLYDKKIPFSDEQIAKRLKISPEKWLSVKEHFLKISLHKIGKNGELHSKRLANYKTKYELYEKESEKKRKPSESYRKFSETHRKNSVQNGIGIGIGREGKGRGKGIRKEDLKDGEQSSPELSTFQQQEKILVQTIKFLWHRRFPEETKFNDGVILNILRGEDQFKKVGPTPHEKIIEIIELVYQEHKKNPLEDPWTRFLDVVQKYPEYV